MSKSTTQPVTVPFHGHDLLTIQDGKTVRVAMKPICDAIGLQWEAQLKRIKRDEVLSTYMSIMDMQLPGDTQRRDVVTLPLDKLNGWLFGVEVKRVKPEIRETLITYKFECHQALADYWQKGFAINPRIPLSPAHQRGIQKAIARRAQSLPKAIQRTAYSRIYSYLKDRFEVGSYKDIDESRYTEALAAVETVSLEGELLEAAMPAEAVEIDLPAAKPWHKLRSHELYGNDIGYRSALSQLLKTLDACKEDGVPVRVKDIDGLKQEVLALRSSLENADERAWTDGELSHLYLVLHYVGLVNRGWHDYRLDEVLRNLESPARAMSESVKVASLYARNIAGHRGRQLLSARDRLGMSGNALLAI